MPYRTPKILLLLLLILLLAGATAFGYLHNRGIALICCKAVDEVSELFNQHVEHTEAILGFSKPKVAVGGLRPEELAMMTAHGKSEKERLVAAGKVPFITTHPGQQGAPLTIAEPDWLSKLPPLDGEEAA